MTRPFTIDPVWTACLNGLVSRPAGLLRRAGLPEDLFRRARPTVSPDGMHRLFAALSEAVGGEAPGLILGQAAAPEVFSPPVFAASCCETLAAASERLALYKPMSGPLRLEAHALAGGLEITLDAEPGVTLAGEHVAAELVFLVNIGRGLTGHPIRPVAIEMVAPPLHRSYAGFFGRDVNPGPFNRVIFAPADARRPFRPATPALFSMFEPTLRPRLDALEVGASTGDRTRSVLMEALPGGQPDVATVARRLGTSSRTLQRRLGAEGTSFQTVLQDIREHLARHYLAATAHTSAEIAFLLGYDDPNSFTRAFHVWTGTTPETHRLRARE